MGGLILCKANTLEISELRSEPDELMLLPHSPVAHLIIISCF